MDASMQKKMLTLAMLISDGDIENEKLICPYCEMSEVVFSFTRSKPPIFGLFIECKICGYSRHFSFGKKPRNFRAEFVLPDYQKRQDQMRQFAENQINKNKLDI